MKLLIAITDKTDAPVAAGAMSAAGYHSTVLNGFGGFLKEENAVILSVIDDTRVSTVLKIISDNCTERTISTPANLLLGSFKLPPQIKVGRVVAFTVDVDQFFKL